VQGAHFVLILYICALSSSSHLAALLTLRKYFQKYKFIAKIRLALVVYFAMFLTTSMVVAIVLSPTQTVDSHGVTLVKTRVQRLSLLVPFFLILVGFSTALVCILYNPEGRGVDPPLPSSPSSFQALVRRVRDIEAQDKSLMLQTLFPARLSLQLMYYLFLNPAITFVIQILLAILSAILVLTQKFAAPDDPSRFCGLHDDGENTWGFGQTLSVTMLLQPAIAALQTYLEAKQDISEGFRSTNG
jgi:hypothetical protein